MPLVQEEGDALKQDVGQLWLQARGGEELMGS